MLAFLIITSLSLAFYLSLLIFLYRGSRKRHASRGSVYKVQTGSAVELAPLSAMVDAGPSRRRNAATVSVRFAVTSHHDRLKSQVVQSEPAKIITLPTLAHDNHDAQCG